MSAGVRVRLEGSEGAYVFADARFVIGVLLSKVETRVEHLDNLGNHLGFDLCPESADLLVQGLDLERKSDCLIRKCSRRGPANCMHKKFSKLSTMRGVVLWERGALRTNLTQTARLKGAAEVQDHFERLLAVELV